DDLGPVVPRPLQRRRPTESAFGHRGDLRIAIIIPAAPPPCLRGSRTMTPFLETDRIVLRRFTEDDAPLVFELDSDPEVMRYVGPYALPTVEAYRRRIRDEWLPADAAHPKRGGFAALHKDTGEFLGW